MFVMGINIFAEDLEMVTVRQKDGEKMQKKQWRKPVVSTLDVKLTSGGTTIRNKENDWVNHGS